MQIKIIKTKRDYHSAVERASALMDARANTPDVAELELLGMVIAHYESRRYPLGPHDPIEAIKFRMDQSGLRGCFKSGCERKTSDFCSDRGANFMAGGREQRVEGAKEQGRFCSLLLRAQIV